MTIRKIPVVFLLVLIAGLAAAASQPIESVHRVVSLLPSATQMMVDLGYGSSLIGITEYCERPSDATQAQIIGSMLMPNLELIATLKPTLVLANVESNKRPTIDRIRDLGIPVLVFDPAQTLDDLVVAFQALAEKLGAQQRATVYLKEFRERLRAITVPLENRPKKRVFVEIWDKPLVTVSSRTFIHTIVEIAAGENIFADASIPYPKISLESVIARKPDVILILSNMSSAEKRVEVYHRFPPLRSCEIISIDSRHVTLPCLSSFLRSVDLISSSLYPDLKKEIEESQ
ncbi:MAG: helical backbone metal receptor [bacterium]